MVCKEDVVSWFKELESYKRIDAMCTLLNMCLPFELRFIGTFLEELGKRDFQELRGAELRANNPTDLAADIGGANTDPRTRRKMALYVSLLRSCNFACATTLYNAMVSLEQSGLLKGLYGDLLEEILLLYTMALHHPAFTFDQKSHFGEILDKLKAEDQRIQFQELQEHINIAPVSGCLTQSSVTPNMSVPPPNLTSLGPPPGIMYVKSSGVQPSSNSPDVVAELGSPPVLTCGGGVVPMMGEVPHAPPGLPLPHYNMDYLGQHTWHGNIIVSPINPPMEVLNYPAAAAVAAAPSPRPPSPSGAGGAGAGGGSGGGTGSSRGASPPPDPHLHPHPHPHPAHPAPLHHLAVNFENITISEMRRMEDERLRELGVPHSAVQQLRSIEKLNGVRRRAPAPDSDSSGSEPASPPPARFLYPPRYPAYPPPPPAYRPPPPPFANGEPPPYPPHPHHLHYPRAAAPPPYGPGPGPLPGPVLYAPPKLSCWNCGAAGHAGHECKEPSMEDMTRAGGYQLDFGAPPPDPDK